MSAFTIHASPLARWSILVEAPDVPTRLVPLERLPASIGRQPDCTVHLPGWRIAREHARLEVFGAGLRIADAGSLLGTRVNGERIAEYGPLGEHDAIEIAGYLLRVVAGSLPLPMADTAGAAARPALGDVDRSSGVDDPGADPRAQHEDADDEARRLVWRRRLHRELLARLDLRRWSGAGEDIAGLRREATGVLGVLVDEAGVDPDSAERERLVKEVLDEAIGLGPLEVLVADPEVTEIMVNGADEIFVERQGRLQRTSLRFTGDDAVRAMVERVIAPLGRRLDESAPMVDARLPDGSRLNAIIPPLAVRGPVVTVRRFHREMLGARRLVDAGSVSEPMLAFLQTCVVHRRNVVVSGGTGTGKTTLLNLLADLVPAHERIVTIEDAAELRLRHPHCIALEARPANAEGRGHVAIRDLVRNALRMRPDRIVVGECRGGEALDMLQAMNTGHDGSLTTVHANGPRDALSRLEVMSLMAGMDLPLSAVREQIASAVDIVVQLARGSDGRRRVVEIAEVTGLEGSRVLMQPLFRHDRAGGRFVGCGSPPGFYEALAAAGVSVDLSPFGPGTSP